MPRAATMVTVVSASIALLAAGCSNSPTGTPQSPDPSPAALKVVRLAVMGPLSGPDAKNGEGMVASVQLAIDQTLETAAKAGLKFEVVKADDQGQQSVGQQQASRVAADPTVVAVIGSANSVVDEGAQPIVNESGLAMVSPGSSAVTLTARGVPDTRPFPTYFRLSAVSPDEGTVSGTIAANDERERVFVVSEGREGSVAQATAFERALKSGGGAVVGRSSKSPAELREPDVATSLAARALALKADAMFVGIDREGFTTLVTGLRTHGWTGPIYTVGSAPVVRPIKPDNEPDPLDGVILTCPGADPSTMKSADDFSRSFAASVDDTEVTPGPFGAPSYDAATIAIEAVVNGAAEAVDGATASPDADPEEAWAAQVRPMVVDAFDAVQRTGAYGFIDFNPQGSSTTRVVGVYGHVSGSWRPRASWVRAVTAANPGAPFHVGG